MRIVEIDKKYISVWLDDEFYRITEAANRYLACHDDKFQNEY